MSAAAEYLRELQQRRARLLDEDGELAEHLRRRDRKPPGTFNDSSFLFVRSMAADDGSRPLPAGPFWLSPDIELVPATSPGPMPAEVQAGQTYRVRVAVRNRGDVGVPSAKVELFLTDPTIGFDTRFATDLTAGQVPSAWVGAGASAGIEHLWQVPGTEAGHQCLFARAFSLSPIDAPKDPHALDPRLDRHVAQRNLNIVGQGATYVFRAVHGGKASMRLAFRPMRAEELLRLDHGALEQVVPARELEHAKWGELLEVELTDGPRGADVERLGDGLRLHVRGDGPDVEEQRELLRAALKLRGRGGTFRVDRGEREVVRRLRDLSASRRRSTFTATVPDLGLQPGEAAGVHIIGLDDGAEDLGPMGGIALVVVG